MGESCQEWPYWVQWRFLGGGKPFCCSILWEFRATEKRSRSSAGLVPRRWRSRLHRTAWPIVLLFPCRLQQGQPFCFPVWSFGPTPRTNWSLGWKADPCSYQWLHQSKWHYAKRWVKAPPRLGCHHSFCPRRLSWGFQLALVRFLWRWLRSLWVLGI